MIRTSLHTGRTCGWSQAINNQLVVNQIYTQLNISTQFWGEHTLIWENRNTPAITDPFRFGKQIKKCLFMNLARSCKWLIANGFPEGASAGLLLPPASVGARPTLVCHRIMKKKSGTCRISIRPSKTAGIYGGNLWPRGEPPNSCFSISKERSPKSRNKLLARLSLSEQDWASEWRSCLG